MKFRRSSRRDATRAFVKTLLNNVRRRKQNQVWVLRVRKKTHKKVKNIFSQVRQRYLCPSVLMGEKEKSGKHFFEYRQSCYKKYFNLYNFFKKPSFFVSVQRNII